MPEYDDILAAAERIRPYVHRTPVLTSRTLDGLAGAQLFFKCENFQRVGAFKFRGATNAVLSLADDEARRGVVTHSSGNHAQALALAARMRGVPATIVMPRTAPQVKLEAVRGYGGEIVLCEPTPAAREEGARKIVSERGAVLVHPFNDDRIIAGQGTAALELLDDIGDVDALFAPVGGGGMLSGSAIVVEHRCPHALVFGCEPQNADDAHRSFHSGVIQPALPPNTIADGLLTSLGERTFAIIRRHVDDILLVSEDEIVAALRLVLERMKIVIEPSSAVAVAAALRDVSRVVPAPAGRPRRVGVILTGGNVDFTRLPFAHPA